MLAFLSGVAIHSFFPLLLIPVSVWWTLVVISVLTILLSGFRVLARNDTQRQGMAYVFLASICLLLGLWRFDVALPQTVESGETRSFVGVLNDVSDGLYGQQGNVVLGSVPFGKGDSLDAMHQDRGINQRVHVTINLKTPVPIGSTVSFSCVLKPVTQKPDELERRFAYRLHFAQATCSPKDLTVVAPAAWWDARQAFADFRIWTNRRIMSVLPGDEGALIAGMLYGERGMSQKSNDLFRRAGLTHLIAVSGSNITIVASIVFAMLLGCGLWRRQAFWLTSIVLFSYVMFTGLSASVARAAVMGWLVLLARHLGRRPRTWHVLLVSAFVLCLVDPWLLAFDAGFALSFLATIGLMVWSPVFVRLLEFMPTAGGLREAAATTISATLMTTPYMAFAFERISLAGLITNLIAVPLVPWAMLFGALSAAWGQMLGWQAIALPALGVAKVIFLAARLADFFPWLSIPMRSMNLTLLVATYGLLVWIWFWLRAKKGFSTNEAPVLSEHAQYKSEC